MKIAIAQIRVEQGEFKKNLKIAENNIKISSSKGAEIIFFPEMFLSGFNYNKNKEFLLKDPKYFEDRLSKLSKENNIAICGTLPAIDDDNNISNRLYFFDENGRNICHYDKIHLFSLFKEDKHIKNGSEIKLLEYKSIKFGFAICYDLRFPEIFRKLSYSGAKVIILPSAWPHPRLNHWQILTRARAIENQCFFLGVNQGGVEKFGINEISYLGSSCLIDPWGESVKECKLSDEELAFVEIDISIVDEVRRKLPALQDRFFIDGK